MKVKPKVTLIAHTPDPEKVIATAAKLCYSASSIGELYDGLTPAKSAQFVERLMNMGHESPIEHVSFTFGIEGISRACSHQLVRHRIASYSQQSQRYVKMDDFNYIVPPAVEEAGLEAEYDAIIAQLADSYNRLQKALSDKLTAQYMAKGVVEQKARAKADKLANEDARFILPNACETKIVVTMNARSLYNFFAHRCCNRAQWEIRDVAEQMYKLVYALAPTLFSHAGPSCVVTGKCPEGAMTCGKATDMIIRYGELRAEAEEN